jgi:hypothetical protein
LNSKKAENVNKALTFEGLRDTGREIAERINSLREVNKARLQDIVYSGIYADKYIKDKKAEFAHQEEETAAECVAELKEAVKKVMETKKAAVNLMLTKAPTQEQLNLLQSLQLQGKSLSKAEITAIIPELADNYRALKTMQSIAQNVGYNVILPPQYDFEEISNQLKVAESYLNARINDLSRPKSEWHLDSDCFYGPAEYKDFRWADISEVLDGNVQTAPVVEPVKKLTDGEKDILNNMFASKYGDDLKAAVNKAAESPNIADLISRSEYAEHIVEAVKES